MAGTYTQLYIQVILVVKHRKKIIDKSWREELNKYIAGIITGKNQKPFIVNGVADHIHCLIGIKPNIAISDLVRDIKNNSSKYINDHGYLKERFQWQSGYSAFSYSKSDITNVYKYILNQETHHERKSLEKEYIGLLREFDIEYDPKYLFDPDE
jgi:REP element-mobilizing transposase RayT